MRLLISARNTFIHDRLYVDVLYRYRCKLLLQKYLKKNVDLYSYISRASNTANLKVVPFAVKVEGKIESCSAYIENPTASELS